MASSRPKRKRVQTKLMENDVLENDEKKLIQMALDLSRKQTRRVYYDIDEAVTYRPTEEEFRNPLKYINSIREEAETYGLCKIVPPAGWDLPPHIPFHSKAKMPTKLQHIHELQEGKGFDDGKTYTLSEYRDMADMFKQQWIRDYHGSDDPGHKVLERDYWDMVETSSRQATVEYANDLDNQRYGSGFPAAWRSSAPIYDVPDEHNLGIEPEPPADSSKGSMFDDKDYYVRTGWNLNLLPRMYNSLLRHIKADISGVNIPWLYVGMLFSTFCWHNEDNYLYSLNYSHCGDSKQWYGVPSSSTPSLEKAVAEANMIRFKESPDLLHHMALQVSPSYLRSQGVPVYQVAQEPGTFIVTFPKAFHGGFSYGFNVGEAVNLAIPDWLKYGGEAAQRYLSIGRPSAISYDRLLCTVLHHLHNRDTLPMSMYPILARDIERIIANELFYRQAALDRGIQQNTTVMPRNDFESMSEKTTDYDELRSCYWCNQYCIFSVVICACDNQSVVCPAHSNKKCRNNKKCPVSHKSLLVWASNEELNNIRKRMHRIMQKHRQELHHEEEGKGEVVCITEDS